MKMLRNPITWGAGALTLVLVASLLLTYVYLNPPGRSKIISFYTVDAVSIRPGDEVRMAGITVGAVSELHLESDKVRVQARVNDDAFVGDRSQVDVRMLTVVGGYYVNVASIGDTPLGTNPIPLQRVTMPYNLVQALTDTTKITENVNPAPIKDSLNRIQEGLNGTNVEAVAGIIDAGNSVMSSIDRQRGQVTEILDLSDEYISTLANYRGELAELVRKVSILTQSLDIYGKGLANTVDGLGEALLALGPIGFFYENHRSDFIEKVRDYQYKTRLFVERNGVTVRLLQRTQNLLDRVLDAENAAPGLLATDLCVPVPGSAC